MDLFSSSDADPTFFSVGRLKTFKHWRFSDDKKCNKRAMAEAGFVVVEPDKLADYVECFICGKLLDGWEETDDPWEEHKKHQASCPYIKINKKDEMEWTIEESYLLMKKFALKNLVKGCSEAKIAMQKKIERQGEIIPNIYTKGKENKKMKTID